MKNLIKNRFYKFFFTLLIVLIAGLLLFLIGLMVGYSISGNEGVFHIFNPSVWDHIRGFLE